jgi:hypothetical protein
MKLSISTLDHWLLTPQMHRLLQKKRMPFTIDGVDKHKELYVYSRKTARSVPDNRCDSPPKEGDVTVSMVRGANMVQISIDPSFLVPWEPKEYGEVAVIHGNLLGCSGSIVGEDDGHFIVRFTEEGMSLNRHFLSKDLAVLEPLRG